jgi:nitrite reductase/ring-hydroxylating ferredoxin subunit
MPDYIPVAHVDEIAVRSARVFTIGRFEVAVFHIEEGFFALENACPHQGGPLAEGFLEDQWVTCPWHAWCFDVRTGKMTLGDFAVVTRFDVRIDGTTILVSSEPENE